MTETKQKHPKVKWVGIPIILTSNSLPPVMHEPERLRNETDWAFKDREIL